MEDKLIMKDATKRSVVRWIHIVFAIPILGYIYSPFDKIPNYAPRNSVCLRSCNGPFGIVDVEGPCRSPTCFKEMGKWCKVVLEPVIFDRRTTAFGKESCDSSRAFNIIP